MSVLERPLSPLKPEIKTKPEVPPRSMQSNSSSPAGGGDSLDIAQGKVKEIAKRFTKQDSKEAGDHLVNGAAELSSSKQVKKPPEVKPKPDISPQPHVGAEEAPPLPKKRSRIPKKQKENVGGVDSEGMKEDRLRSAPDGKIGNIYVTLSRCCSKTCTCMCHLKRPGMMLIWVPVDEHENKCPGGKGEEKEGVQKEEMDVKGQKVQNEQDIKTSKNKEVKPAEKEEEMLRKEKEVGGLKAEFGLEAQEVNKNGKLELVGQEVEVKETEKKDSKKRMEVQQEEKEVEKQNELQMQKTEKEMEVNAAEKKAEDPTEEEEKICEENQEVGEVGDEEHRAPVVDEKAVKSHFQQSLEILLAGGPRKPSDQAPQNTQPRCRPASPKRPQPPPVQTQPLKDEDEEESIYELLLPEAGQLPRKLSSPRTVLYIPEIKVHKPALRDKHASCTLDSTPEIESIVGPAIPPRAPLNDVSVPYKESNSPGSNPLSTRVRPPPPKTSPPCSPLTPRRPPPAPPKTDSRRPSNISLPSIIMFGEENKTNTEKEDIEQCLFKRTCSSKGEFHLKEEPLYQTYSDTAIKKELLRQTIIRNISKTSTDYAMELSAHFTDKRFGKSNGDKLARSSPVPEGSQSTLWQDLAAVRDSGMLHQLTTEQIKYQESMFEVLTSEASYLRSLRVLIEHFMENRELGETLIISDRKTLFSNILKVREVSERFFNDLEDHIYKEILFPDICNIINYHAKHNFSTYIDYIRNQTYQEKTYTRLMKTNEQFATVINRLQELPDCQRLPFISFLLLPFQRITRIKMLVENILRRTKEGTTEEQTASKALASVSKIIDDCNRDVGKMRQMEELLEISKMLEFDKLRAIPIVSETRYLEKKGELQEMSKSKTFVNMRAKFSPVYLFLFNDQLLITVKKSSDRYVVLDYTHRSLIEAQPLDDVPVGPAYENCFNLIMLENQQGRMMERILKAPSKSDMQRWLAVFPNPTKEEIDEEVIYEDWDCPQVQCVEQYVAQQADELSLEPTEIINVLRKTNEGWYEGIRLSDGQRGWFPDVNVIEITNEHVRRRNIKERYRVSQATRMVKYSKNR